MLSGLLKNVDKPSMATGAVVSKHVDERTYIKDTVIPSIRKVANMDKVYENIAYDKDLYRLIKTNQNVSEKKDVFVLQVPGIIKMRSVDDCSEMKDRFSFPSASRALLHYFTRSLDPDPRMTVYVLKSFDTLTDISKLAENITRSISPFPLAIVVLHISGIDSILAFSVFSVREKSFFMLGSCTGLLDRASEDLSASGKAPVPSRKRIKPSPLGLASSSTPTLSVSTPIASVVMKLTSPLSNMSSRASTPFAMSRLGTLISPTSTVGSGTASSPAVPLVNADWRNNRADLVADACDVFCLPPDDKVSFDTLAMIANHRILSLTTIHRDLCDSVCRNSLLVSGVSSPGVNRNDQFGRWIRPLVYSKDFYEPLSRYALAVSSLMLVQINHIQWMPRWLAEMETVLFTSRIVLGDIGTSELHVLLQNAAAQIMEETTHCVPTGSDNTNSLLMDIDYASFEPADVEWPWARCSGMTWKRPGTMLGPRFSLPDSQDVLLCSSMHHGSPVRPLKTFRVAFSTWSAMSKWFNLMDAEHAENGTVFVSELHVRAFMTVLALEANLSLFGNQHVGDRMASIRDGQMTVWWKRNAASVMHNPTTPDKNIVIGIMDDEKRAMDAHKNMSTRKRFSNGNTQRQPPSEMYNSSSKSVAEMVPDIEDVATFMPPCQIGIMRKLERENHIGYHEITSYVPVLVNLGYSGQKIVDHVWKYFSQEHALPKEKQHRPRAKKDVAMEIETLVNKVVSSKAVSFKDLNGQRSGASGGFIGDGCVGHQNRLVKDSPASSVAGCPFVRCGNDKTRLAAVLAYQDNPTASDAIVSMPSSLEPSKRCAALLQDRHAVQRSFPVKSPAEYVKRAVYHSLGDKKELNI